MLIREARRRELEGRAVRAVWGEPRAARMALRARQGPLQRSGSAIRRGTRFYSQKDLEHLQGLILAAGYNPAQACCQFCSLPSC